MMHLRTLLLGLAVSATPLLAQGGGRIVDEGAFLVTRAGAASETESFRITRTDDGLYRATGQLIAGAQRVTSTLVADSLGTPVSYTVSVRDKGDATVTVSAVSHAGRLSARSQLQHGDESMREYPLTTGRSLILEDGLVHQTFFVALGKRTGAVTVVNPRAGRDAPFTVAALGMEPITIAGQQVTAMHYALRGGAGAREFWTDANGRLLQVAMPSLGIKATREELPR
jgi:hypothetical protein